jgi:O-antigen ligase
MLMLVPLGLCQFWGQEGKRKALAAVATALAAIGCVLAFSRGAAVGFALMLVLMTVMRQLKVKQLTLIGVGLLLLMLAIPQYSKRLASLGSLIGLARGSTSAPELDGALRGRATVMLAALKVAADYPVLGVGPGMFNYYAQEYGNEGGLRALVETRAAHCLYLELAAEHGIPGLLCFLAMVGVSLTNLVRMKRWWAGRDQRMEYLASGYILAIASYLSTGLFLHFSYARYFWLVLAIADATSNVGRTRAEEWLRNAGSNSPSQEGATQPC